MKFRRKSLVVDAMQWNGPQDNDALRAFAGHWVSIFNDKVVVTTPDRPTTTTPGDYILHWKDGEFWVLVPEFFQKHYEPIADGDNWS